MFSRRGAWFRGSAVPPRVASGSNKAQDGVGERYIVRSVRRIAKIKGMRLRPRCAYPNLSRWLTRDTAHYRFTLTFRDRSRKSSFAILPDRSSMPRPESTPRKVIPLANPFAAARWMPLGGRVVQMSSDGSWRAGSRPTNPRRVLD
jgi:hypothetical protein